MTEGKGQLEGIEVPSRPVGRRRRLVHALKRLGEGLLALVSALQSDLADGPSGKSQQLGRLSEPAALHIVMKRHSHRLCEHAVQVVFGVVDRLRHRLQFQPAAQRLSIYLMTVCIPRTALSSIEAPPLWMV